GRRHRTGPRRRHRLCPPEAARPGDPPARRLGAALLLRRCRRSPVLGGRISHAAPPGPGPPGRGVRCPGASPRATPRPSVTGPGTIDHSRTPEPRPHRAGAVSGHTEAAFSVLVEL